jgi:hypothetical protein
MLKFSLRRNSLISVDMGLMCSCTARYFKVTSSFNSLTCCRNFRISSFSFFSAFLFSRGLSLKVHMALIEFSCFLYQSFATLHDLSDYQDKRRLAAFHLHLRGPALTWFNSLSEESRENWVNVKILMFWFI